MIRKRGSPEHHGRHAHHPTRDEVEVTGIESCRALFSRRPEAIRRVFLIRRTAAELQDLVAFCQARRVPWHVVEVDELTDIADTVKHDGVCIFAARKPPATLDELWRAVEQAKGPMALLLLDGVKNPNNVGAIARVCAYFRVPFILAAGETTGFTTAAMRTAQGGAEAVDIVPVGDGRNVLAGLKARGFTVLATSSHARLRLGEARPPDRVVFLFGSENAGLSRALADAADSVVAIPGAGGIESLNVACASSVVLWEHWRSFRLAESAPAPASTATRRSQPRDERRGPPPQGRRPGPPGRSKRRR